MKIPQKTIALVEDDGLARAETCEYLRYNNYEVISAGTQSDFEKKIANADVDIFLIDLGLPDGDGLEVIRGLKGRANCGIIVLSGRSDDIDKIVCLEVGADDYITKPFNPRELLARVHSLLRRVENKNETADLSTESTTDGIISFLDWSLDANTRQLFDADNIETPLTRSEFDLLFFFLKNPNRALSRETLIANLRGSNWAGYDRAMDGLVSRLRGKLNKGNSSINYIKTMHGVGYLFIPKPEYS